MKRTITGFHRDQEGDWVAELDCGHGQHTRHRPPFISRPWVVTAAGRRKVLGAELYCVLCERMEWPEGFAAYKRTPEFTETTVPAGLTRNHTTKRGVWARLHVVSGELDYHVEAPVDRSFRVAAGASEVIVPELPHRVGVIGAVCFYVEFWRAASGKSA